MSIDKKAFLKGATVIYDTREQQNKHILSELEKMGVMTEERKLDFGDYSFSVDGRDFSMACVIERKANVNELYGNVMGDERERIEKELYAASKLTKQFTVLIENIASWEELKAFEVSDEDMARFNRQVKAIGAHVYSALKAWCPNNRYCFNVEFVKDKKATAAKMLEIFYYYWRSYKEMTKARKK